MEETVAIVLKKRHPQKKLPTWYTLEVYDKIHILVPVDITDDVVKSVAWKLLESSGPRGTDSEYLQKWILKFEED